VPRVGPPAGWLTGSYGRWVIDLDRGWSTERLDLEPLAAAHAAELAPLLDDTSLHEFTGGALLSSAALAARYARLAARRSPGGDQMRGNWVEQLMVSVGGGRPSKGHALIADPLAPRRERGLQRKARQGLPRPAS
jgi:hypothetical protein